MIKINFDRVDMSRSVLQLLIQESFSVADPLIQSRGKATRTEKEIITMLLKICNEDLPALINNSDRLLAVISESFQKAEQTAQSTFEK